MLDKDAEVDKELWLRRVVVQILAYILRIISNSLHFFEIRESEESLKLGFDKSVTKFNTWEVKKGKESTQFVKVIGKK